MRRHTSMIYCVLFSMQRATVDNVRKPTLGYFTPAQISEAEDALWGNSDWEIIGEKPRRKSSNTRPDEEAHLNDILCAINELDAGSKMPCVVIDAYSLSQIPRSHPEELNNISLLDRLNSLKEAVSGLIYKKECPLNYDYMIKICLISQINQIVNTQCIIAWISNIRCTK